MNGKQLRIRDAWWCDEHDDIHRGRIEDFTIEHRCALHPMYAHQRQEAPFRTKSGKVLTDADFEALADEAEAGYDVARLKRRPTRKRSGRAEPSRPMASWCEAHIVVEHGAIVADNRILEPGIERICVGRATHRHHKLRRSQGGADDASNTLDLCAACHAWIHTHPEISYRHGWLIRS